MAAAKSNAVNKISAAIIFSLTGFLPSITSKVFSSLHKLLLLVQPNIGVVYRSLNQYSKALEILQQALTIWSQGGDGFPMAS
jgi:tetratricopeptide (TPR) repeat protein